MGVRNVKHDYSTGYVSCRPRAKNIRGKNMMTNSGRVIELILGRFLFMFKSLGFCFKDKLEAYYSLKLS